jgi:hypothetical protein
MRAAIPRWTLSKAELIETVGAEIDNGSLRIAQTGDWAVLSAELASIERTVRASGSVAYGAPTGKHDDLVIALALATFGCRRLVARNRVQRPRRERVTSQGWT